MPGSAPGLGRAFGSPTSGPCRGLRSSRGGFRRASPQGEGPLLFGCMDALVDAFVRLTEGEAGAYGGGDGTAASGGTAQVGERSTWI